ncbi:MAG TPA: hypothetical protein VGN83_10885 [Falsiroseomonas sp.]|nr:hypothetical protein [Falsiroseomonas sp.]
MSSSPAQTVIGEWIRFLAENKDGASRVAVFVTFLALLASPLIQRWIALRQQKGSVVSANRVRWIEEFRRDVAVFCELAHHVAYHRAKMGEAERKRDKEQYDRSRSEINDKSVPLNTTYYHLIMRLNPKKSGTQQIKDKLKKIDDHCNDIRVYDDDFYRNINMCIEELMKLVRDYLAIEWHKVERLQ